MTIKKNGLDDPCRLLLKVCANQSYGGCRCLFRASREENQPDRLSDAHATNELRVSLYKKAQPFGGKGFTDKHPRD